MSIVPLESSSIEEIGIIDPTEFVRQIVISSSFGKTIGSSEGVMKTSRALGDKPDSSDHDDNDHDGEDSDNFDDSEEECEDAENVFTPYILKHHQGDIEKFKRDLVRMQHTLGR